MPSYLNDESSTIYANQDHVLDLDPTRQFGLPLGKDGPHAGSLHQGPVNYTNSESFDESSTSSTQGSELSDTTHMPGNGSITRPTSMNSLPNGKGPPAGHDSRTKGELLSNGSLTNGYHHNLPDRTAPRKASSEVNGSDDASWRVSGSSLGRDTVTPSLGVQPQAHGTQSTIKPVSEAITSSSGLHVQDTEPAIRPSSLAHSASQNETGDPKSQPHRLSSPPHFQSGSASTSGHLSPGPMPLKTRHTLEVPKPAGNRGSKDGMDYAQASGRFSPTVARRASISLARRNTRSMQSDVPRDEVVPDEDAFRWAEAYRQKRASKRRRKEEEDDDRVLVGTKVDETHANWVTAYNMLTGIRVAVSRTNAKLDRELTDEDFQAKQKSTFDIAGNELVPSAKYDFKFKDYAPWVFRRLRSLFRLDPADYLVSLTGKYILSELGSPGKSGSFFYFSRDYKYIIKTIHHAEHKFLRKILKEYYQHVENNPNTLLSQFYGLHRVKMPYGKKIHFVVMNNLFPPHRDIHQTFDLKGSTIGRDYKEDDLENNPRATLKDLNWLRRKRNLELGIQKKQLFLEQLRKDVVLMKKLQIMDYSLLIGIHDLSRGNEENLRDKTLRVFNPGGEKPKAADDEPNSVLLRTPSTMENARKARELRQMIRQERPIPMGQAMDRMPNELGVAHTRPGFVFNQDDGGFQATHEDDSPAEEIYYLGVIDCLTHYGMIKKIEHFWKGLSSDRSQISALPPDQYGDRFYNFVEGITLSSEEAHREAMRKDQEAMEAARVSTERRARHGSQRKPNAGIPPMPTHAPPPPPNGRTARSPEARETIKMAGKEAQRSREHGANEEQVPDRTLKTTATSSEYREPGHLDNVLPIVEETGESDVRPATPLKDKALPPMKAPPPTPPKPSVFLKPQSADSGYAGHAYDPTPTLRKKMSKDSLNKSLPPLPGSAQKGGSAMLA